MEKTPQERAQELYPNNRTFCGGVASIARGAYIKGCQETEDHLAEERKMMLDSIRAAVEEHLREGAKKLRAAEDGDDPGEVNYWDGYGKCAEAILESLE